MAIGLIPTLTDIELEELDVDVLVVFVEGSYDCVVELELELLDAIGTLTELTGIPNEGSIAPRNPRLLLRLGGGGGGEGDGVGGGSGVSSTSTGTPAGQVPGVTL